MKYNLKHRFYAVILAIMLWLQYTAMIPESQYTKVNDHYSITAKSYS